LATTSPETQTGILRVLLWNILTAVVSAAAALAAKQAADRIWRLMTGEAPPKKKWK
jgi:hypothetical protein